MINNFEVHGLTAAPLNTSETMATPLASRDGYVFSKGQKQDRIAFSCDSKYSVAVKIINDPSSFFGRIKEFFLTLSQRYIILQETSNQKILINTNSLMKRLRISENMLQEAIRNNKLGVVLNQYQQLYMNYDIENESVIKSKDATNGDDLGFSFQDWTAGVRDLFIDNQSVHKVVGFNKKIKFIKSQQNNFSNIIVLVKKLGSGLYSNVYRAENIKKGIAQALIVPRSNKKTNNNDLHQKNAEKDILNAFNNLEYLHSQNVQGIQEQLSDTTINVNNHGKPGRLTKYYANGNYFNYAKENTNSSSNQILKEFVHAAQAVKGIHNLNMRHGDIKGGNFLVDEAGNPVLADMGGIYNLDRLTKTEEGLRNYYSSFVHTKLFVSQEDLAIIQGNFNRLERTDPLSNNELEVMYGLILEMEKSRDIYALGCMFVERLTSKGYERDAEIIFPNNTPQKLINLIKEMLNANRNLRPSAANVYQRLLELQ